MYDPTIGRWISEDPIGFKAADEDLYRYVRNSPTNATDPSGFQAVPNTRIGGRWQAQLEWRGPFTPAERDTVRQAFFNAAGRVTNALRMMEDWDETTRRFRFDEIPGVRIASDTWGRINTHRQWFYNKLRTVYAALTDPNTVIPVENRPQETHADTNPMYTLSERPWALGREAPIAIHLRSTYWRLSTGNGPYSQGYWTTHELARFFHLMEDDSAERVLHIPSRTGLYSFGPDGTSEVRLGGVGVQSWDAYIDWLYTRR